LIDVQNGLLLPGLIDLHAHPAGAGSRFGIDADEYFLKRGATTVLSQGDAGARNARRYIQEAIETVETRVRLALNFCADGEVKPGGRFFSLDEASVDECVRALREGQPHIWGISLNIALIQGRDVDPLEVMRRGIAAAEQAGCPVIFGATKDTQTPLEEQLRLLRPGDVMTYCFHPGDGKITQGGRVLDCAWEAKERGVLFDVGDGLAAFGYDVAQTAISEGFLPDSHSSDFFRWRLDEGVMLDLPTVVSKLVAAGMTPEQCWPGTTSVPAQILGMTGQVGALSKGAAADFCVLELGESAELLTDGLGQERSARRWEPTLVIKGGSIVRDDRRA
jgi:dihydroorotase